MRHFRSIVLFSLAGLPVLSAYALGTEAELLAAGAEKVPPAALRERLVRGVQTGKALSGGDFRVKNTGDGRYTGNVVMPTGGNAGVFGKWWIDDNGRSCADSNFDPKPSCVQYYHLSGRYFVVYDSDNAKRAFERVFSE